MNFFGLVFDRLHAGYLGAYGNAWIETPQFDRLASQSFLFDQVLLDTPHLEPLYHSYWEGRHAGCAPGAQRGPTLVEQLAAQGVETVLITDEVQVIGHELARAFRRRIEIEPPPLSGLAETLDDMHLAASLAQVIECLEGLPEPFFVWCHLAALGTHWDAPWEYRTRYVEEGDPPAQRDPRPPEMRLPVGADPDVAVSAYQAYAGQIAAWDVCLGGLCEFIDDSPFAARTLLAVTSARGYPLGEHGRIGACDGALYGPLVHIPLLLRLPDHAEAVGRSGALVEPADLGATGGDWMGVAAGSALTGRSLLPLARDQADALHDRLLVLGADGQRGLRTPAWYLRQGERIELFAKPDDRWEANDVADRCHEVLEALQTALAAQEHALATGDLANLAPLDDRLVYGME